MTSWGDWIRHPQTIWARRALFQIHRWAGIGIGIYIFVMSVSGSLIVYRDELSLAFSRAVMVTGQGRRLTNDELTRAVQARHPRCTLAEIYDQPNPRQAIEVRLECGGKHMDRLFDPYTGEDLGNRLALGFRLILWLVNLHDDLLSGQSGRRVNGIGACLFTVLALTGSVIWWPGIHNWRNSLTIDWEAGPKRLVWTIHSFLGFWLYLFILLWGISGIYLCFPDAFTAVFRVFDPFDSSVSSADIATLWLSRLHFGRFAGAGVKAVWTAAGLVPATLFVTGATVWWNRFLRPRLWQSKATLHEERAKPSRP